MKTHGIVYLGACVAILTSCAGGDVEEEETSLASRASFQEACNEACKEGLYTPCTCSADDPCGWASDGICDRACRRYVDEVETFDDRDCPECGMTVCLTGAVRHTPSGATGGNSRFSTLCEDPRIPGLIPDCRGQDCQSTWTNFLHDPEGGMLDQLRDALDTNGDARVDEEDQICQLNLIGFSWGGVNAIAMARAIKDSPDFFGSRSMVDRLIVVDPYQPGGEPHMKIPPNVMLTRNYRQSQYTEGDCSEWSPLGPYFGMPLVCDAWQDCVGYDYSLAPEELFWMEGEFVQGREVGHCMVPAVAHEAMIADILSVPSASTRPPKTVILRPAEGP